MKLLVLDLDETLIFGTERELERPCDFSVGPYFVYLRPGLDSFLEAVARIYELGVWTASTQGYADPIVERIFPHAKPSFVWARSRCTMRFNPDTVEHEWVKNLDKLKKKGYDLNQVLMVDDTPEKLLRHYGNLVRVKSWEGNPTDTELSQLATYLEALANVPNVRTIEKRQWRPNSNSKIDSRRS